MASPGHEYIDQGSLHNTFILIEQSPVMVQANQYRHSTCYSNRTISDL